MRRRSIVVVWCHLILRSSFTTDYFYTPGSKDHRGKKTIIIIRVLYLVAGDHVLLLLRAMRARLLPAFESCPYLSVSARRLSCQLWSVHAM